MLDINQFVFQVKSLTDIHQLFHITLKDTIFYFTASKSISCTATVFFSPAPADQILKIKCSLSLSLPVTLERNFCFLGNCKKSLSDNIEAMIMPI